MRRVYTLTADILERIREQCVSRGDCVIWMGRVSRKDRWITPVISVGGTGWSVRRFIKADELKDLPMNYYPVTTCGEPRCVAREHLIIKNMREIQAPPQRRKLIGGDAPLPVEYCAYGHEMTEENTYWYGPKGTGRRCRQCYLEYKKRRRERLKALKRGDDFESLRQ